MIHIYPYMTLVRYPESSVDLFIFKDEQNYYKRDLQGIWYQIINGRTIYKKIDFEYIINSDPNLAKFILYHINILNMTKEELLEEFGTKHFKVYF